LLIQVALCGGWSLHPSKWYTEYEHDEDQMLTDILFLATILMTRVALPIMLTFIIGSLLNRALHRNQIAGC